LYQLRKIKYEGADDSNYVHTRAYADLESEQFADIDYADDLRLRGLVAALKFVADQRAVPDKKMRTVLTDEQYTEYVNSFGYELSHVERELDDDIPLQLSEYLDQVRQGDKYTRIANMFKHSKKRDGRGRTAYNTYTDKAFGCYEEAVMDLCNCIETDPTRNPLPDEKLSALMLRCLDRDVDPTPGFEPDVSIAGVPRLRGSRSKYTLIDADPVIGVRLRKYWRQREALSIAALELLYAEPEEDLLTEEQQQQLRDKYNKLLKLRDDEF
jgi:hypothetical protein